MSQETRTNIFEYFYGEACSKHRRNKMIREFSLKFGVNKVKLIRSRLIRSTRLISIAILYFLLKDNQCTSLYLHLYFGYRNFFGSIIYRRVYQCSRKSERSRLPILKHHRTFLIPLDNRHYLGWLSEFRDICGDRSWRNTWYTADSSIYPLSGSLSLARILMETQQTTFVISWHNQK